VRQEEGGGETLVVEVKIIKILHNREQGLKPGGESPRNYRSTKAGGNKNLLS